MSCFSFLILMSKFLPLNFERKKGGGYVNVDVDVRTCACMHAWMGGRSLSLFKWLCLLFGLW